MSPTQFFTPYFSNKEAVRHQPQPCGGAIWLPGSPAFWQHRPPSPPAASAPSVGEWGGRGPGLGGLRSLAGCPRGGDRSFMRAGNRELFLSACLNPGLRGRCRVNKLCWALCFHVLDVDCPQHVCTYS